MPNVFEQGMVCPRCGEQAVRVIQEVDKPTKFFHSRNNQEDLVHEDLTADIPIVHSEHLVDRMPLCMPVEFWENRKYYASAHEDQVTCQKCKGVLEQMHRVIDRE